jgi:hypothetical protein
MATKRIEIIYDVNGKAIDVAVDSTLNLKKQVVELTKALRSAKEGSDEFKVLSSRLGDAQDQLAKTTAKSKDLFSSLSMLPGPVGQFFGQLQGAVELLKTFSSFSMKDLNFQLGETVNDLKDIKQGFSGAGSGMDETGDKASALQEALKETTNSISNVGQTAKELTIDAKYVTKELDQFKSATSNLESNGLKPLTNALGKTDEIAIEVAGQTKILTADQIKLAATNKTLTASVDQTTGALVLMGTAEKAATVATFTLRGALMALAAATGIGLIFVALGYLIGLLGDAVTYLYKLASGTLAAEDATKKLGKALDDLEVSFEKSNKAIKRSTNERIAMMKAQGATEEQIRKATLEGLITERDQTSKTLGETVEVIKKLQANRGKNDEENNKQIERALKKKRELEETYKDQSSAIRVSEYNNITENNKKIAEDNKKAVDEGNKLLEKRNADRKTADEAYRQLLQENSVLSLKTERERQLKELENQSVNEKLKIDALDISEKRKEEIKLQITTKYAAKSTELKNKFNEEDLKKEKEHSEKVEESKKKLSDIEIAAIQNQTIKEKQQRENKYNEDLKDLKKSYDDKLITLTEYQMAVINLNQALVNDLKKIDDDAKKRENDALLQKLDDDIRFQEISNEANKNSFSAYWKGRETLLEKSKQRELSQLDLTEAQKIAIEKKYVQLSKDLQREKFETYVGYLNQGLGAAQNILNQQSQITNQEQQLELDKLQLAFNAQQEYNAKTITSKEEFDKQTVKNERELALQQDKIKEEYFYKNRAAQKAQAMISAFQAAISAYSSLAAIPVVGPFLGAAAAAVALAFGIKQANLIGQQKYVSSVAAEGPSGEASKPPMANYGKNYGDGGMIDGPRHAGGGVMINAEGGEAVMTRGAVTMFAPLLSAMNVAGGGTSFSKGALGQSNNDNPKTTEVMTQPQIIKTYVVSSELTTEVQKQARLKDLSTL